MDSVRRLFASALALTGTLAGAADDISRRPFPDPRHPPPYQTPPPNRQSEIDLGHAIFNTQWVPAGTPGAARRDGLGPLFNAASCDACHNEGAHGRGPTGDGEIPAALVIELATDDRNDGPRSLGDPRYGRTLNTSALDGFKPEALVKVRFQEISGRYPDGLTWHRREPHYQISALQYGPLAPRTIVQPRLAPALFGIGLLEAVSDAPAARIGWQGTSTSILDQTTKAFARDMGLTTSEVREDDCTAVQRLCRKAIDGGRPEVSDEFLRAIVEFQRTLAVPPAAVPVNDDSSAAQLFARIGCSGCHRKALSVRLPDADGTERRHEIDAFTDLRLHDLGTGLSDRTVAGRRINSRWRTAPLWGMNDRIRRESTPTFLHDGRARSIEEAILWHAGEAEQSQRAFQALPASNRQQLLVWIATL